MTSSTNTWAIGHTLAGNLYISKSKNQNVTDVHGLLFLPPISQENCSFRMTTIAALKAFDQFSHIYRFFVVNIRSSSGCWYHFKRLEKQVHLNRRLDSLLSLLHFLQYNQGYYSHMSYKVTNWTRFRKHYKKNVF